MLKNEKPKKVEEFADAVSKYSVIGLVNIHKMPAKTFQIMRKNLRGRAEMKVGKSTIIKRSFEKAGRVKDLEVHVKGAQCLLLSNDNPFKLFKILKENVTPAAAKIGDIAPKDISVPAGPTPVPPGPGIATFQKVGLKTTVQAGKIAVAQEKVIAKTGEKITEEMVNVLNLLKIEPMEIGLNLTAVWENGVIYTRDVLNIDTDEYVRNIGKAAQEMINLSVNTGYPTKDSIEVMIKKAFAESKALCTSADILEKGFTDDVLAKAIRQAMTLEGVVGNGDKK